MTASTDPLALVAALRLEDGRPWGQVAEQFQLDDMRAILAPDDGAPRLHWLGRPKGGSKSTDLGAVALAWLDGMAAPLDEGFALASDQDQARRLLARAAGLVSRTPGMGHLQVQSHRIVNRRTEASVVALAADAAGAEGTVSPLYLVDELPQWPDTRSARAMWDAAYSSIPKGASLPGGVRFVVIGHAGISGSWQDALFRQVSASPSWRVNDVAGALPWIDAALLEDQRATLTPSQYARRHLNVWSSAEDSLTTVDDLRACVTLDGPLRPVQGVDYVIAVDLGLSNDRTVVAVMHAEPMSGGGAGPSWRTPSESERYAALRGGRQLASRVPVVDVEPVRIVVDRLQTWQGSKKTKVNLAEVEAFVLEASRSYNAAPVRFDPWQAVSTAQRLRANGVTVEEFTFSSSSVGRLASTLYRLLRDGAIALPDDPVLLDELAHVRLVERSPGVVRLDHDAGRHDDMAVTVALGAALLLERPVSVVPSVVAYENVALDGSR